MKTKELKRNRGITLIALVITIIILLILVGVSINAITGDNGIITQAQSASEKTKVASIKEEIETELFAKAVDGGGQYTKDDVAEVAKQVTGNDLIDGKVTTKEGLEIDLTYLLEKGSENKPKETFLVAGEYASEVGKYKDASGKIATIPEGFTVSNIEGEKNIDTGLVIYKGDVSSTDWTNTTVTSNIMKSNNQYVWIPCTSESYKRTEWACEEDGNPASKSFKDETTLSSVTLSDYDKTTGKLTNDILNNIVKQISDEKTSVAKYGGYYIGRYETGVGNVITKYKSPYTSIIWSKAYSEASSIDVGSGNKSYLCSSYARDTAINFIQDYSVFTTYATSRENATDGTAMNENWYDTSVTYKNASGNNETKMANNGTILPTGVTTAKCNIFDLGGNVNESTTELNPLTNGDNDATVVLRGGSSYRY